MNRATYLVANDQVRGAIHYLRTTLRKLGCQERGEIGVDLVQEEHHYTTVARQEATICCCHHPGAWRRGAHLPDFGRERGAHDAKIDGVRCTC